MDENGQIETVLIARGDKQLHSVAVLVTVRT